VHVNGHVAEDDVREGGAFVPLGHGGNEDLDSGELLPCLDFAVVDDHGRFLLPSKRSGCARGRRPRPVGRRCQITPMASSHDGEPCSQVPSGSTQHPSRASAPPSDIQLCICSMDGIPAPPPRSGSWSSFTSRETMSAWPDRSKVVMSFAHHGAPLTWNVRCVTSSRPCLLSFSTRSVQPVTRG